MATKKLIIFEELARLQTPTKCFMGDGSFREIILLEINPVKAFSPIMFSDGTPAGEMERIINIKVYYAFKDNGEWRLPSLPVIIRPVTKWLYREE